jgi:hypothetical protein
MDTIKMFCVKVAGFQFAANQKILKGKPGNGLTSGVIQRASEVNV